MRNPAVQNYKRKESEGQGYWDGRRRMAASWDGRVCVLRSQGEWRSSQLNQLLTRDGSRETSVT